MRVQRRHPEGAMVEGTAGSSPERKEAALNYWLQMATVIRAVAGELEGVRTMEWLRGIAATAGIMLSHESGHIGRVVREVGGTLCATHMDGDRIHAYFGRRRKVASAKALEKIAREGIPDEAGVGGNLGSELAYGNHRSALKHRGEVLRKAATDAAMDRTIVFPATQASEVEGLRILPVGVVDKKRNCG